MIHDPAHIEFKAPRAFFLHYSKPATRQAGAPRISVHVAGTCHIVTNVFCQVSTHGRIRKTQPRWVLAGRARHFVVGPAGEMTIF